ncbi:MAG: hypothetical protein ACRCWQ_14070 [Bacilli bacterium]
MRINGIWKTALFSLFLLVGCRENFVKEGIWESDKGGTLVFYSNQEFSWYSDESDENDFVKGEYTILDDNEERYLVLNINEETDNGTVKKSNEKITLLMLQDGQEKMLVKKKNTNFVYQFELQH